MYFWHTSGVKEFQNSSIPFISSCKLLGLYDVLRYCFREPQQFSGRFCWGSPPINSMKFEKPLYILTGMFWVVVLLKTVSIRKTSFCEWHQTSFNNLAEPDCIHDTIEHYYPCSSPLRNTAPNMHLSRVLWSLLQHPTFFFLAKAQPSMMVQLDSALISKDNILKLFIIIQLLLAPVLSLQFIWISNQLTVVWPRTNPATLITVSLDCC